MQDKPKHDIKLKKISDNEWEIEKTGKMTRLIISLPSALSRYIVPKGSIALDGVSLTVVSADRSRFSVALIPHTQSETTLGELSVGESVNIEVDLMAKYLERLYG